MAPSLETQTHCYPIDDPAVTQALYDHFSSMVLVQLRAPSDFSCVVEVNEDPHTRANFQARLILSSNDGAIHAISEVHDQPPGIPGLPQPAGTIAYEAVMPGTEVQNPFERTYPKSPPLNTRAKVDYGQVMAEITQALGRPGEHNYQRYLEKGPHGATVYVDVFAKRVGEFLVEARGRTNPHDPLAVASCPGDISCYSIQIHGSGWDVKLFEPRETILHAVRSIANAYESGGWQRAVQELREISNDCHDV